MIYHTFYEMIPYCDNLSKTIIQFIDSHIENENKELKLHLTEIESAYNKLQDEFNNKMRDELSSELNDNELKSEVSILKNEKETLESTISSLNTELSEHEKKLNML